MNAPARPTPLIMPTRRMPKHLPCLVDPTCPIDHLNDPRKGRVRRG